MEILDILLYYHLDFWLLPSLLIVLITAFMVLFVHLMRESKENFDQMSSQDDNCQENSQEDSQIGETHEEKKNNNNIQETDLSDINLHLQQELASCISDKISVVSSEIMMKKNCLDKKIETIEKEKSEKLAELEAKFMKEKEEIESKYKEEEDKAQDEFRAESEELKKSIKNLRVILTPTLESPEETVETSKSELECPVCMEEMKPPKRIWQCSDGHTVCEFCRRKPEVTCCPTCRKYIVGRSTIAEKLARSLFCDQAKVSENTEESNRITLTGYREVAIERE